jgi:endonuclease YncB( thermonuclease family)
MAEPVPAYVRKAEFISAHDGDTVTLRLDHGRFPSVRSVDEVPIRVRNLYCPELSEEGGPEARDFAHEILSGAQRITVQTYKGSFARTVADIWVDGQLYAELAVAAGHGAPHP